jgi:DNA replication and repair protein RecF
MELLELSIHRLRNLNSVEFETDASFNIFYGDNGAGKTSILEAIHILSHGRSFRNSRINPLIQHEQPKLWITGQIQVSRSIHRLGVERSKRGLIARVDGKNVKGILKLSECFPTLALHPETFNFLKGDPAQRRAFLDWGAFYADPLFIDHWRLYKKALKQRNSALKQGLSKKNILLWNEPLAESGEYIDRCRKRYISNLSSELPNLMAKFEQNHEISITVKQGWSDDITLNEALKSSLDRDIRSGYTHSGPHRADVFVKLNTHSVAQYASRGQLKLVTVLLKLAQCSLFVKTNRNSCVLLLDDLSSELDDKSFSNVISVVKELELQCFITSINPINQLGHIDVSYKMFHVEHGLIEEVV